MDACQQEKKLGNFGPKTSNQWDTSSGTGRCCWMFRFFLAAALILRELRAKGVSPLRIMKMDPMGEADLNLVTWLEEIC